MSGFQRHRGLNYEAAAEVQRKRFRGWTTRACNGCGDQSRDDGVMWPLAVYEERPMIAPPPPITEGPHRGEPVILRQDVDRHAPRIKACPRCEYTSRFNMANRRAANAGEPLPIWGVWQPVEGDAPWGYNPWTGALLALPLLEPVEVPEWVDRSVLTRAPTGFKKLGAGYVHSPQPELPLGRTTAEANKLVKAMLAEPEAAAPAPAPAKGKVNAIMLAREAARLYRDGYRADDVMALAECVEAMEAGR